MKKTVHFHQCVHTFAYWLHCMTMLLAIQNHLTGDPIATCQHPLLHFCPREAQLAGAAGVDHIFYVGQKRACTGLIVQLTMSPLHIYIYIYLYIPQHQPSVNCCSLWTVT